MWTAVAGSPYEWRDESKKSALSLVDVTFLAEGALPAGERSAVAISAGISLRADD